MKGLPQRRGGRSPRVGWLLLGLAGGLLVGPRWAGRDAVRAEPAGAPVVFAARALGTLVVETELASAPAGGPRLRRLPAGISLRIGGLVRTPGGSRRSAPFIVAASISSSAPDPSRHTARRPVLHSR